MNGKKARLSRKILDQQVKNHSADIKNRSIRLKIKLFIISVFDKFIFWIKYIYNVNVKGLIYRSTVRSIKGFGRKIKRDIKKSADMPSYYHSRRMKKRKYKDRYGKIK